MATLVTFHAHPDDEAIGSGGTIAKAKADGHRVVLVTATRGEYGEVPDGLLAEGESLADRRVQELIRAADILGIDRVEFLGYTDSGMVDTETNSLDGSFWTADVEEAAARLADVLRDERADVLTVYDDHGVYGHPDHIQVHRVGVRAAELAGTPKVYEMTMDRDYLLSMMKLARDDNRFGEDLPDAEMPDEEGMQHLGVPSHLITTRVDVRDFIDAKRSALAAHASQVSDSHFFLAMPPDAFREAFGLEWFILRDAPAGTSETDLFEGVG